MLGGKAGHLKLPEPCWTASVQAGVMGQGWELGSGRLQLGEARPLGQSWGPEMGQVEGSGLLSASPSPRGLLGPGATQCRWASGG